MLRDSMHIVDIAMDWYGRRLASCSIDRLIRIYRRVHEPSGGIKLVEESVLPVNHTAAILRLAWAHPEFGQVLASCSCDRTVIVYEEIYDPKKKAQQWVKRASLADAGDDVTDVRFCPYQSGLKIAACSKDGYLRIYEALDPMNLHMWHKTHEFVVDSSSCYSICFNPSPLNPLQLAAGTDLGIYIFCLSSSARYWVKIAELCSFDARDIAWAPSWGRTENCIAVSSTDRMVRIYTMSKSSEASEMQTFVNILEHSRNDMPQRILWNTTGSNLAITYGSGSNESIFRSPYGDWELLCKERTKFLTSVDQKK